MTQEQAQTKFNEWYQVQQQLEALKEQELQLRIEVCAIYFADAPEEGSTTKPLEGGWKLTHNAKINRTLANKKGETDSIISQLPPEVAETVFKLTPSLQMKGYKNLESQYRALVDSVITSKPGTPSLKLVPPKGDK